MTRRLEPTSVHEDAPPFTQRWTNIWLKTDKFQIPAIQCNERRKLSVLRRVRSCRIRGFEPGTRFAFTQAAFPHKVGRATFATRDLIFVIAVDPDRLWVDLVTLRTFNLRRDEV